MASSLFVSPVSRPALASPATPQFFSPTSVWNRPAAPTAPVDPASAVTVSNLMGQLSHSTPWINTDHWSTPIYTVGGTQPAVDITLDAVCCAALMNAFHGVPLPSDAAVAQGTDANLIVYQPSSDTMWEFYQLVNNAGTWHARWGGKLSSVSTSDGLFDGQPTWGASASGMPMAGGLITLQDLAKGEIDHAVYLAIPAPALNAFRFPATRTDGYDTSSGAIAEGSWFRIDPNVDISRLGLSPLGTMIARAAQTYGVYIRDTAGAVTFYGEDPTPTGTNPYPALYASQYANHAFDGFPWSSFQLLQPPSSSWAAPAPGTPATQAPTVNTIAGSSGYRLLSADGGVHAYGSSTALGNGLNQSTGIVSSKTGAGYLTYSANGGVVAYGDAAKYGSLTNVHLNAGIVNGAMSADGAGYWLLGGDGGIFAFGDANFYGSTGSIKLNKPVVGMAPTPTGHGYWLVASDGGIFAFGDANFYGSTGSIKLNKPVVGMAPTPTGHGYWLVASDGGIFAFGDANFYGSTGSIKLNSPIVGMQSTPAGDGYRFVASDGGVFCFGTANFLGSLGSGGASAPVVGMSS